MFFLEFIFTNKGIQPGMTISSELNNKKAGEVNNKKGKKLNQIIKIIQ
jgi:hypothetical protein